jgi:small nuclear ribonucleoprotein (snRNP)-like protein
LDVLGGADGKKVLVRVKSGEDVSGILKAFDSHINLFLEDAEIRDRENEVTYVLGTVLIRGDSIIFISPFS